MVYLFHTYELDEEEFCLTRQGQRVPLEPRALRVLLLLVQNQGKLLLKDTILEAVWKNTFVEESTLSRAVAILRKQLGDDPRDPTFIETVPTLGYRFIANVQTPSLAKQSVTTTEAEVSRKQPKTPQTTSVTSQVGDDGGEVAVRVEEVAGHEGQKNARLPRQVGPSILWLLLGLLLSSAVGAVLWFALRHPPMLAEKKSLVLGDFANSTGDPVFNDTLREGMAVQLEQSPMLSLVSEPRIQSTLRLMSQPTGARLTPVLAREICQRTGSAAVLDGSIASLGSQYVLALKATNCITGETLDTEQVQAARKEDVLQALSEVASRFRNRVGESLASIKSLDTPLDEATTSSLEALKAYSDCNRVENANGSAAALPFAQRAVELDPKFAMAWAMLGRLYGDIGQELLSAKSTAKAYEFRDHASDRERFFIVASYEMQVTGNLEKAKQTCETWAQVYPNEAGAFGFRTGLILRVFGQYDKAAEKATELIRIHRDFALAYHFLAVNDIALGRFTDAQHVLESASARNLEIPFYSLDRYRLAFLAGDEAGMRRVTTMAAKLPGTEDMIAGQEASSLAYSGHLSKAREVSQRAVNLMKQSGRQEAAARSEAGAALQQAFLGNQEQTKRIAMAALDLSKGRDAEFGAAFALALSQNSPLAEELADDLEQRFPEDTSVRFHYVPAIRALIALNHKDPARAIELLETNVPYELGSPQSSFSGFYGMLYPVYVRGLTYLAMDRGTEASGEFRKILDHPGIVVNDPIGALARLQLGRAYLQLGNTVRAKAAYTDFLSLWKTADPGIPVLKEAQTEYSRLR